jgi:hypothetical protein
VIRVARKRLERFEPVPPEAPRRDGEYNGTGCREAEMADGPPAGARLEQAEREKDHGDPLDENRGGPCGTRQLPAADRHGGERSHDERGHPGVVVSSPGELEREQRIPPDECAGEGSPP